jgi:DNA-binding CsgD family transcriptional regulator
MKDLSPRQREILALVAAGRTSKEIAGELGISESTVNWHLSNVFERLGASSRAEAVAIVMREDADAEVAATDEAPPRARPSLPVTEVALAFVLTLLLGLIGGAVIAEWDRKVPPTPLSPASAAPGSGAAQTAGPTGRPLVDVPDSDADGTPVPLDAISPTARPTLVPSVTEPGLVPNVAPNELPVVGPLPGLRVPAFPAAPAGILPSLP